MDSSEPFSEFMHEATRLGAGLEGSSDLPARRTNDRGHEEERGALRFEQTEAWNISDNTAEP
jgi:hypothetical protein